MPRKVGVAQMQLQLQLRVRVRVRGLQVLEIGRMGIRLRLTLLMYE